jgi:hypothetical protein
MRRRLGVIPVAASLVLVFLGSSRAAPLRNHRAVPLRNHRSSCTVPQPIGVLASVSGANWSPNFPLGTETTESQALALATTRVFVPSVSVASDATLTHAWVGSVSPAQGMLPKEEVIQVAFSYSSGVVVTYRPWQYGAHAAPFSEAQIAQYMRDHVVAEQAQGSKNYFDAVRGIPVIVSPQDCPQDPPGGGPGDLDFHLGTALSNAVEVMVIGRLPSADLEAVAASVIAKWQAANDAAA